MVPSTRVVSTTIWCISWRHNAGGCTHPWKVYVIPHGPICIRVFSPLGTDCVVLPLDVPLGSN